MERVKEREREFRKGDWGVKYLFRGPRIDWGIILLKPGTELGRHLHKQVEETFYFLHGKGKIRVGEEEFSAGEGDAFRIDPGEPHNIYNDSPGELKIIFIKTPYLPEDKVSL